MSLYELLMEQPMNPLPVQVAGLLRFVLQLPHAREVTQESQPGDGIQVRVAASTCR